MLATRPANISFLITCSVIGCTVGYEPLLSLREQHKLKNAWKSIKNNIQFIITNLKHDTALLNNKYLIKFKESLFRNTLEPRQLKQHHTLT
jgi:hypothetical protein